MDDLEKKRSRIAHLEGELREIGEEISYLIERLLLVEEIIKIVLKD